jgi:hypothetical protein
MNRTLKDTAFFRRITGPDLAVNELLGSPSGYGVSGGFGLAEAARSPFLFLS